MNYLKKIGSVFALILMSQVSWAQKSEITVNPFPIKMALECDELAEKSTPVTASSTCSGELTYKVNDVQFSGGCLGTLERTTTITDACGTTKEVKQYITLLDNKMPVIDPVEDVTVANLTEVVLPKAMDNCSGEVEVTFTDELRNDGGTVVTIRTYSAKDSCANTAYLKQKITQLSVEN